MLETVRKYTGVMFFLLVLLFVGLIFLMEGGIGLDTIGKQIVFKANGRGYSAKEYRRMGENTTRLAKSLAQQNYAAQTDFLQYLQSLQGSSAGSDNSGIRFVVNRKHLQEAAAQYGISASDQEVETYLKEKIFIKQPDGGFDSTAYQTFLNKELPRLGMSLKDMNDTVAEVITFNKIVKLLGAGIEGDRHALQKQVQLQGQQIDLHYIEWNQSNFEGLQSPTAEEIEKFWQENKHNYLSEPQRQISYILQTAETKPVPELPPLPDATDLSEEDKKVRGALEAANEAIQKSNAEAIAALGNDLETLWDNLQASEGVGFEQLAKENEYEVQTSELFTREAAPDFLQQALRSTVDSKSVLDSVFTRKPSEDNLMDAISDVTELGSSSLLLFKVTKAVDATELSFDQAKGQATLDLQKKLATEAMMAAATSAKEAIQKDITAGKSFAEAAKAQNLEAKEIKELSYYSAAGIEDVDPQKIYEMSSRVNPGELSEIVNQDDSKRAIHRALLSQVTDRRIKENEQAERWIDSMVERNTTDLQRIAFENWLLQRYAQAEVVTTNP